VIGKPRDRSNFATTVATVFPPPEKKFFGGFYFTVSRVKDLIRFTSTFR
jgi:hypothetical protein